ncbi:polysaccharide lyase family 7 protein [Litorimonas sp. RW-G-Af-16]|uniref:polysaccharide lyase family 7 protein n=1 Tax=Litorimonas sp. RW-G-Af-16 TaxID=3241168 RepID=UPI003AAC72ED
MQFKYLTLAFIVSLASAGMSANVYAQDSNASYPPFELDDWYLGLPSDDDGNGKSDSISETELANGWTDPRYFYPSDDGGIVFKAPVKGAKTTNTTYTRTELREMLRRGNKKHKTSEPGKNNWVFSTAAKRYRKKAGGVDGELEATLAVNHVTTTGDKSQVGRVIIGQIHAKDNEPVRLYYRKLPHHTNGSLYFAHEINNPKSEFYTPLLGDRSNSADDPVDGIPLNEKFGYKIVALGDALQVDILRQGKVVARNRIDMSKSGYAHRDEYMYFKAGVYNQNKTGDDDDYVQATFYELVNRHESPK